MITFFIETFFNETFPQQPKKFYIIVSSSPTTSCPSCSPT